MVPQMRFPIHAASAANLLPHGIPPLAQALQQFNNLLIIRLIVRKTPPIRSVLRTALGPSLLHGRGWPWV